MRLESVLVGILRLIGALLSCAALAVLLPNAWMESIHSALGLGEFPRYPLTEYLARSTSALYAIHGGILLLASSDIRRFEPLIRYCGIAGFLFGVTVTAIDLRAGMPLYWTLNEGPPTALGNVVVLYLNARVRGQRLAATDS